MMKTQPSLSRIEIMGRLLSREIIDDEHLNLNAGLYQHFDFFDSDTIRAEEKNELIPETVPYKMGTPASVGGGAMIRYIPNHQMSLDGFAHFNLVALAGVSTDFYRDYHRNYSWGMGYSVKAGVNWALSNDKISVKIANQFYHLFTRNNFDSQYTWMTRPNGASIEIDGGDNGVTTFNHFETNINYRLIRHLYLTGGFDLYTRHTYYKDMILYILDNQTKMAAVSGLKWDSRQIGAHIMLTYKF